MPPKPRFSPVTLLLLTLLPVAAPADPGRAMPGVSFLDGLLSQLSGPVAMVITGLGIAFGAICWILGSRDGLQKCLYAAVGGGLLFLVKPIVGFLQGLAN